MKRKRHPPEQVIRKLREADSELSAGKGIAEVCQKLEVSEATFIRSGALIDFDQGERIPIPTTVSQTKDGVATSISYEDLGGAIAGTAAWDHGSMDARVALIWKVEISGLKPSPTRRRRRRLRRPSGWLNMSSARSPASDRKPPVTRCARPLFRSRAPNSRNASS
ncbi:MAG: hypothetical protein FLDDKLPJ_03589 [Phycisphaerae bacterium]|nr:hypothetical protein [Phycisphaerae bacterium]